MNARFAAGDRVRVLDLDISGHMRTPHYVRHQTGTIERYCGAYPNPEHLAYARRGEPPVHLYRVRFPQTALWPDYAGSPDDQLEIEVYEHWLAPA